MPLFTKEQVDVITRKYQDTEQAKAAEILCNVDGVVDGKSCQPIV